VKYRIGILNDFKDTKTVVDFQKYGQMEVVGAFEIGGQHRGYQLKEDSIWIFLNYQKVAEVKSKAEAIGILRKLIKDCPPEAKSTFAEFEEILFRRMRD
jgi:hypothetical protein